MTTTPTVQLRAIVLAAKELPNHKKEDIGLHYSSGGGGMTPNEARYIQSAKIGGVEIEMIQY